MVLANQPDVTISRPLQRILGEYFIQRVLPLERQYYQLICRQYALLRQLGHQTQLEDDLQEEMVAWRVELRRSLKSHLFSHKPLPNEAILWALFGSNSGEEVKNNIDSFCQHRTFQIAHIQQLLTEIISLSGLKRQLKQRRCKQPHIACFLDESPQVYARS